jgi:hypothetical protein
MLSFMLRTISLFTALLVFAGQCVPQTLKTPETPPPASAKLTIGRLASAARTYLRDSAEFPLSMQLSIMAVSASGRTIRKDHATGTYDFHGYNPRSENAYAHARLTTGFFHSPKHLLPAFMNTFAASLLPSQILSREEEEHYSLEASEPLGSGEVLTARIRKLSGCPEFNWLPERSWPKNLCGTSQFEIQKDDLSFRHLSFDASGLPVATTVKPFGKCELRTYHADVEFQKVTLPDDPKPFLVPKHVEVVVETDKGKLDMTTDYTPRK